MKVASQDTLAALIAAARRKTGSLKSLDHGQTIDFDLPMGEWWLIHRLANALESSRSELQRIAAILPSAIWNDKGVLVWSELDIQRLQQQLGETAPVPSSLPSKVCADCGTALNDGEAKTFTVCDACWDKAYPKISPEPSRGESSKK